MPARAIWSTGQGSLWRSGMAAATPTTATPFTLIQAQSLTVDTNPNLDGRYPPPDQSLYNCAQPVGLVSLRYIVCPGSASPRSGKGSTLNIAVPTNRPDPLLRLWSKSSPNSLLNRTSANPLAAWQNDTGEWRFMAANGSAVTIYSSTDNFVSWKTAGTLEGLKGRGSALLSFRCQG